jgi:hypothetical protein
LSKLSNAELLALRQISLEGAKARVAGEVVPEFMVAAHSLFAPDDGKLDLKQIACSDRDYETVTYGEARNVYGSLLRAVAQLLGIGLSLTLAASLAVYAIVRAIGWVIGGFAAS